MLSKREQKGWAREYAAYKRAMADDGQASPGQSSGAHAGIRTPYKLAPLFPRYLFVRFDPQLSAWAKINSTRGCERVLMRADGEPALVPPQVMDALLARMNGGLVDLGNGAEIPAPSVRHADQISIGSGPMSGHSGLFDHYADDSRRAWVLLSLMGRSVRVLVDSASVRSVAA